MPDIRDALHGAGFQGTKPQDNRQGRQPTGNPDERGRMENPFPKDYPKYFTDDEKKHTRVELVTTEAENLAIRFESEKLKRHQLRAFYDHAKRQLQRLSYGTPFGEIHAEIGRLKAFAANRSGRADNALPPSFKEFIDRNVGAVIDEDSFKKGFMPHFEAVVAYCARLRES